MSGAPLGVTSPSRAEFRALAHEHRVVPVTRRVLADAETPVSAYRKLAGDRPGTFLLESAENGRSWSRWSFIGAGSATALTVVDGQAHWQGIVPAGAPTGGDPLQVLRETLALLQSERLPDLPPLTGGMVGYLGYDMVRRMERLPCTAVDDLQLPEMVMLLATDLAAVDHHEGTITLIANAVNFDGSDERVDEAYTAAVQRLDAMTASLAAPSSSTVTTFDRPKAEFRRQRTSAQHEAGVRRLIGEIEAGEAFQVVLSQRFEMPTQADPLDVYRVLRASNPSQMLTAVLHLTLSAPAPKRSSPWWRGQPPLIRLPAPAGAATPWRRTSSWRRTCGPTPRRMRSTSCSSTWAVTTSAGSASPAPSR
jgi:anthranilate synthase component 1